MVNRREFLQATAAGGVGMVATDLAYAVPSGAVPTKIQIPEAEKIVITVVTDNYYDQFRLDDKIAKRHFSKKRFGNCLHAEHGLAYHIETVVNGEAHSGLFDYAVLSDGVLRNLDLLEIDFKNVEALALSHDHGDHNAAMAEVLRAKKSDFTKTIPFYIGEQFFAGTYIRRRGEIFPASPLKREEVERLGFVRITEIKGPTPFIPGAYLPGRIELVTDYEKLSPMFLAKKGNEFVQETFLGEQTVILNAKGKGLVVLSGCAHRGIVNAIRQAQTMTGIEKVHAIMGGFHLINAKPEVILKTVADFKEINPDYIVPTHCTGFEAITTFAREMADKFILNTAGTRYII